MNTTATTTAAPSHTMPYPGLRPFEEADQSLFFGREEQIGGLLRQLEDAAFVAVVGSSGSGKSSSVRAGLLPAMREGFLFGTTDWRIAVIKPGHEPYQRLARELARCVSTVEEQELLKTLRRSDRGLLAAVDAAGIGPEANVLVVVDQFEELFAFRRAGASQDNVASRDEAAAFVAMLLRTAADSDSRVRIVLTMRSDFIGDCEAFLGLPEAISRSQFLVPRLNRSQMEDAIVRPGKIRDAEFQPFAFEEGLVNRIINDAGDRPDQLPLMQHALMRTWKFSDKNKNLLTHNDYSLLAGGIEGALSKHADAAWHEINDARLQQIARRMFLLLCDVSPDGQITRRRPKVSEVMAVAGDQRNEGEAMAAVKLEEVEAVVRAFQRDDRNFLLPPGPASLTEDTVLDLSHEALLRQWKRFGEWLDQERQDAAEFRRLCELAKIRRQDPKNADLLPARDLGRIAMWQARVSANWSQRYVPGAWGEALAFVEASREQAERMWVIRVLIGMVLVLATVISTWLMFQAEAAKLEARNAAVTAQKAQGKMQEALVGSFARTIGVVEDESSPPEERAALWDLAELDITAVRERLLDQWFQSLEPFEQANRRSALGLRAAGELNPSIRHEISAHAIELALRLATALKKETDVNRLSRLNESLAALAGRLEPAQASLLAERLATALEKETDRHRLTILSDCLAALAERLKPADAARLAGCLATVLEKEADQHRLTILTDTLAALAGRLEPAEATLLAKRLTTALEKGTDADRRLSDTLAALAGRLEPAEAALLAERLATVLEKETDWYRLTILSDTLAALAGRLPPAEATLLAKHLAAVLEKETDGNRLSSLSDILAALAGRLEPEDAVRLAERPATAMEKETDAGRLSSLSDSLAALAGRLESTRATELAGRGAERLATLMEKETDAGRLSSLSDSLATLAGRLESAEAARLGERLAAALEKETDADRLSRLSASLGALVDRLDPAEASRLAGLGAECLATAIEKETDADRLSSLSDTLSAMAGHLEPAEAAQLAERLATALEEETDADRLSSLSASLAALAGRFAPAEAARLAGRVAESLATVLSKETDENRLTRLSYSLAALAERLDPVEAGRLAEHLATALQKKETDAYRLRSLSGDALAALTGRLEPVEAARLAEYLTMAMEKETDGYRLDVLSYSLAALVGRLDPAEAARLAERLATAMEKKTDADRLSILSDYLATLEKVAGWDRLSSLSVSLAALAGRLEPVNAARLAERLATATEKETDAVRLSILRDSLAALAGRLEPVEAARLADRLATAIKKETDAERVSILSYSLAALAGRLEPAAHQTRLFALSSLPLNTIPGPPGEGKQDDEPRKVIAASLQPLSKEELVEVLKWPFCVGEAEKMVLLALEGKLNRPNAFGGDLGKFVDLAPSLGITNLATPAHRPRLEDVRKELAALRQAQASKP